KGFAGAETEGALAKAPQSVESASAALDSESAAQDNSALAPQPGAAAPANADALRDAAVNALAADGHESASQLLGEGNWILDASSLRIEVAGMGKKMIALTVNAAAEKIIRQELQRLGAPTRFLVVPGEGAVNAKAARPAVPAGALQKDVLAHPLVKKAQEIFQAEVRSVIDLRKP
ncbi:MAG TPA: hypothetical protein VGR64_11120, partial [Terracidiphilus sp.]|nr:hypothetical protein [Terracidiphilus sp.]